MRTPLAVSAAASAVCVVAALAGAAHAQVSIDSSTQGVPGPTGGPTPDPDYALAWTGSATLEISTGHVAIRDGGLKPIATMTSEAFWIAAGVPASPAPNAFEHRALQEPTTGRLVISADEHVATAGTSNRRYLAISTTTDPSGPWRALVLPADAAITNTRLAVDDAGLYLTGDTDDGHTRVVAIPLADVLVDPPTLAHATTFTIAEPGALPASSAGGYVAIGTPNAVFAARGVTTTGSTNIRVYTLVWDADGVTPNLSAPIDYDLGAIFGPPPAFAVQPIPQLLDVGDGHLRGLGYALGVLTGVGQTQVDGRAALFTFQLSVPGTLLSRSTFAFSGYDIVAPDLSVSADGDLLVVATMTSSTLSPTPFVTGTSAGGIGFEQQLPSDAPFACGSGASTSFGRYPAIASTYGGYSLIETMTGTAGADCAYGSTISVVELQENHPGDDFFFEDDAGFPPPPIDDEPVGQGACSASPDPRAALWPALALAALAVLSRVRASRRARRAR